MYEFEEGYMFPYELTKLTCLINLLSLYTLLHFVFTDTSTTSAIIKSILVYFESSYLF